MKTFLSQRSVEKSEICAKQKHWYFIGLCSVLPLVLQAWAHGKFNANPDDGGA